jgi:hypothetical protein
VRHRLLTPVGLRSLAPDHPDYRRNYHGDLYSRDSAYHQGTVWPWLIGPFIAAWVKAYPEDRKGARRFLEGLIAAPRYEPWLDQRDIRCRGTLYGSGLCCSSLECRGSVAILGDHLIVRKSFTPYGLRRRFPTFGGGQNSPNDSSSDLSNERPRFLTGTWSIAAKRGADSDPREPYPSNFS